MDTIGFNRDREERYLPRESSITIDRPEKERVVLYDADGNKLIRVPRVGYEVTSGFESLAIPTLYDHRGKSLNEDPVMGFNVGERKK
ncbi:MAG: hypothetical protein KKB31_04705 [Nanoarchaeota archaeon]|nr:hypothetical protein [Nanoarchaeota archaeon]